MRLFGITKNEEDTIMCNVIVLIVISEVHSIAFRYSKDDSYMDDRLDKI